MPKTLQDILNGLPEDRQQRIEKLFQERLEEHWTLQELRKALGITQEDIADTLNIHQVNVSKMEKRTDLKISTLKEYLAGLGFNLKLVAEAPGHEPVILKGLGDTA